MSASSAAQPGLAGVKRPAPDDEPVFEKFLLTPLGAGNEVGRSCIIMRYKGKTIMLDCGVLPSFQGEQALPLLREIDPAEIDIVIIT
jgi:cleavage and polyadenylation specificity factor subunit 3